MKKLAIVSSHGEMCGIASYTNSLAREFSKHYDVQIQELQVGLLRSPQAHELANTSLRAMAKKLQEFDYVSIQFEAGLFGIIPRQIAKRFKILADASKNLIVTFHSFDLKQQNISLKNIVYDCLRLRFKTVFSKISNAILAKADANLLTDIVSYCKKHNAAIIVHTKREKKFISQFYKFDKVYDHPLTTLSPEELDDYKKKSSRKKFNQKYHLQEKDIVIGLFGFLSPYKGFITAINALEHLPDNYKILIFGSQHPLSILPFQDINIYIKSIVSYISERDLIHRVKFCGGLDDDNFIKALLCCNFTVLPYIEVNQSASAVAALAIETGIPAIFSQTLAFLEFEKYAKNAMKLFSIGNFLELADAIKYYDDAEFAEGRQKYLNQYNLQTNIILYKKIFEGQEEF